MTASALWLAAFQIFRDQVQSRLTEDEAPAAEELEREAREIERGIAVLDPQVDGSRCLELADQMLLGRRKYLPLRTRRCYLST